MAIDAHSNGGTLTLNPAALEEDSPIEEPTVSAEPTPAVHERRRFTRRSLVVIAGIAVVLTLAGVNGWQGWQAETLRRAAEQRELFLAAGRQGAINLTTIDFAQAEADVDRILGSATGAFRDDFSQRSQPFLEVVKQARSKSVGTVTEAGVESVTDDGAKVLVAVAVKTSMAGTPDEQSRAWRMRVSVQKVDNDLKVANVEFVP